jgi:hypothetical protein
MQIFILRFSNRFILMQKKNKTDVEGKAHYETPQKFMTTNPIYDKKLNKCEGFACK